MPVSLDLITKNSNIAIAVGEPMGMLLCLTYAEAVETGLIVTLETKH
jgi:hypothetical protein